jgi:purine-binding chemotaxis protein CheW
MGGIPDTPGGAAPEGHQARTTLVGRLRRLEEELSRAQGELAALGGETLPGLHLVVDAGGRRGLLAAFWVQEVVRLVALEPIAGAPPAILGTLVWHGAPVVAVDLAALLGVARVPALDAQIAVLAGAPTIGLVLDRVHSLHEHPQLHASSGEELPGWEGSRLVAGLCTVGGEVLPLLDPGPVIASVREEFA